MCTAVSYQTKDFYFGRNLDLEYSYRETVTVTPRNYPFRFLRVPELSSHLAMIGTAFVVDDRPLYYDAVNEKGLAMAGLYFPHSAVSRPPEEGKDNVASFELIPWILGQCSTLSQVRALAGRLSLLKADLSRELLSVPQHWIVVSREGALTLEPLEDGLKVWENPIGVLTNEPPFDHQMLRLSDYMCLSPGRAVSRFCEKPKLSPYSKGTAAMGLPGDFSSVSRFVRASFAGLNARSGSSETESVNQVFHILNSVSVPRGCVDLGKGQYQITVYSSCCNTDKGIYYYTTYENSRITGVDLHREDLDGCCPISYPMLEQTSFRIQN